MRAQRARQLLVSHGAELPDVGYRANADLGATYISVEVAGMSSTTKVADGLVLGSEQSALPWRLARVIILISDVVIHLITWDLLAIV